MWIYKNEIITEIEPKYIAFVYMITNLTNNRRYIGKKLTKFSRTKKVKGKNKRYKVDSDWQTYWSSSDELKDDVKSLGEHNFKREILHFCMTKGEASYLEASEQFSHGVLLDYSFYNGIINCKIHKTHVKNLWKNETFPSEKSALQTPKNSV